MFLNISFSGYDFIVLLSVLIISLSGIFININKNADKNNILFESDSASIKLFRFLIIAAIIIGFLIYIFRIDIIKLNYKFIPVLGFVLFFVGITIRWIAIVSLGKAFNVKVTIIKNQKLHTSGIYKYIRHPSYTGLIIYYIGLALIMSNMLCLLIFVSASLTVVLNRIKIEERLLTKHYKSEYLNYKQQTYRIFPFIF